MTEVYDWRCVIIIQNMYTVHVVLFGVISISCWHRKIKHHDFYTRLGSGSLPGRRQPKLLVRA